MKKAMLWAAFAAGLSSMSAVADKWPSIESHESKELNPKVLVAQESVKDKAKLTLSILNDDIISGQETKSYFSALGIDMNKISWVRLKEKNYDLENRQMVSLKELGISKDVPFTVDNIGPTLDRVMASMREFQPWADKQVAKQLQQSLEQRFSEFTLIDQEVDLLNKLLTIIPDEVEPIAFINAVTGIVNLNKINNVSSLDEWQQITLVSNVWSVMSLLKPETVGTTLSIVVPRGTKVGAQVLDQPVEYPSMEIDRETVRLISQSGIELPIEMVSGYQESFKRYQDILAELKQKAEIQTSEKRAERYMRFYNQYADTFARMPTTSKMDMLEILATENDEGSKLKGQKLLDKASEYIAIMDGWFTEENVKKLRIYHKFIVKYNETWDNILDDIILDRLTLLKKENDRLDELIDIKKNKLEELIALRKQMQMLAYNSN